jgi:hypothetical protein
MTFTFWSSLNRIPIKSTSPIKKSSHLRPVYLTFQKMNTLYRCQIHNWSSTWNSNGTKPTTIESSTKARNRSKKLAKCGTIWMPWNRSTWAVDWGAKATWFWFGYGRRSKSIWKLGWFNITTLSMIFSVWYTKYEHTLNITNPMKVSNIKCKFKH